MARTGRLTLVFIVICVLSLSACASKSELEKAAEARATYKATLNSFFVRETPLEVQSEGEAPEDAPEEPAEDVEGVEMDTEPEAPAIRLDVVLDVIVQHDTARPLPGLTLDIEMVEIVRDAAGDIQDEVQKARWLYWVDTEGLPKANQRPFSITFEDVDYVEGYAFYVEVRHPIPAAERADYREFDGLSASE